MGRFAADNHIPWCGFPKNDRKIDVMRPYLARQAATGRAGVAAIGVAQEFQNVFTAAHRTGRNGIPWFSFSKADRRVTCLFYVFDGDFGPAFIKVCTYFPYPIKVWLNGHEWSKRQAAKAGIEFTELSNGFAACADPAALQAICDRLGPATIGVFFGRWMSRLPLPLTEHDRDAGYWWELSMRQVEVSRTAVTGITNKSLRALMTGLLGGTAYTTNRASYDLARLRRNGLIHRVPGRNHYRLTSDGLRFATFYTKSTTGCCAPCWPPTSHPPATAPKCLAHHRHSHQRNHRPGPPSTERSLKLKTTLNVLATKGRYAAAGTSPGSGGPSGSFTSRARVVS